MQELVQEHWTKLPYKRYQIKAASSTRELQINIIYPILGVVHEHCTKLPYDLYQIKAASSTKALHTNTI